MWARRSSGWLKANTWLAAWLGVMFGFLAIVVTIAIRDPTPQVGGEPPVSGLSEVSSPSDSSAPTGSTNSSGAPVALSSVGWDEIVDGTAVGRTEYINLIPRPEALTWSLASRGCGETTLDALFTLPDAQSEVAAQVGLTDDVVEMVVVDVAILEESGATVASARLSSNDRIGSLVTEPMSGTFRLKMTVVSPTRADECLTSIEVAAFDTLVRWRN